MQAIATMMNGARSPMAPAIAPPAAGPAIAPSAQAAFIIPKAMPCARPAWSAPLAINANAGVKRTP